MTYGRDIPNVSYLGQLGLTNPLLVHKLLRINVERATPLFTQAYLARIARPNKPTYSEQNIEGQCIIGDKLDTRAFILEHTKDSLRNT